jgi:hypothetical protein
MAAQQKVKDLPPDNAARLAIYDALFGEEGTPGSEVTPDELFEQVIGRLRILVPRELHNLGERTYVDEKIRACIDAGIITTRSDSGRWLLVLSGQLPQVRYPDGDIHDYTPGLELARERLDGDNARLRAVGFDVRNLVPSIADEPDGPQFKALLESMREHGFLKQFPVVEHEDGCVVDGRARVRAAAILKINVVYLKLLTVKDKKAARRRDNPLNRVMVATHSNAERLATDHLEVVHEGVAAATRRSWAATAADLELTRGWRLSMPPEYSPVFDVEKLPYRPGDEPKVQVTSDAKVMLRSLVETAGLASYKIDTQLAEYVTIEDVRTQFSGRKAKFARADDLITGIAAMQRERRSAGRTLDPEWEQISTWLVKTFGSEPS